MQIHTMSEGITLARQLETAIADCYENLARQNAAGAEILLSLAGESKKNITQVERAYYGEISDALEGCFSLDLNTDNYELDTAAVKDLPYQEALNRAIAMETKITQFYSDAAGQCRSLMATVSRAFTLLARKRQQRLDKIKSIQS